MEDQLFRTIDDSIKVVKDPWSKDIDEIRSLLHKLVENLATSKPTPVRFQRFSGEDPELWISQAERYFEFYYLEGEALEWFQWLLRNKQLTDWDHFVAKVRIHFHKQHLESAEGHMATIKDYSTEIEAQMFDNMSHGCCCSKLFTTERSDVNVLTDAMESNSNNENSEDIQVFDESSHRDEVSASLMQSTHVFEDLFRQVSIQLRDPQQHAKASFVDNFEIATELLESSLSNFNSLVVSFCFNWNVETQSGTTIAEEEKSRTSVVLIFDNIPQRVANSLLLSSISHKESWVILFLSRVPVLPRDKKFILANEVPDNETYVPDDILLVESANPDWLEEFVLFIKQSLRQNFQCLFLSCIVLNRSTTLPTSFYKDKCYMHLLMVLCAGGKLFDATITRGCSLEKDPADSFRQLPNVVHNGHFMVVMHKELKLESSLPVSKDEYAMQRLVLDFISSSME
ncbi:calcium-dependent protein kinase 29 [Nicotiana attenuata]|uniref:Calcium-dependent protein kinase 29 n=1 Tax=Nicotiana attenuata TaxID=49451 RepID=A0A314LBR9_NICAT|nr:calcium-dependent protein kinase 29 [Nicotiana attenuata]